MQSSRAIPTYAKTSRSLKYFILLLENRRVKGMIDAGFRGRTMIFTHSNRLHDSCYSSLIRVCFGAEVEYPYSNPTCTMLKELISPSIPWNDLNLSSLFRGYYNTMGAD